jgi:hypothetical protein
MTQKQCKKCPWKVSTDPREIPGGYCEAKHRELDSTVARPGDISGIRGPVLRVMACHESPVGRELPCVGWLAHQLGVGNNIPLRLAVLSGRISADVETVGPQHDSLEATLPKKRSRRRRREPEGPEV